MPIVAQRDRFGARGAALILAGQWTKYSIQLTSVVLLSRILGPQQYGLIAIVLGIFNIALTFSDFGLSMSALQAQEVSRQQHSNLLWVNLLLGVILCAVFNALARPIASFYDQPAVGPVCHALSPVFVLVGAAAQYRVALTRDGRYGSIALADIGASILALATAVTLGLHEFGATALIAQQIVSAAVGLALLFISNPWWPSRPRRGVGTAKFITLGGTLFFTYFVNSISSNVDAIALGRYQPLTTVGLYNRSLQLARQPLIQVMTPLTALAMPRANRAGSDPGQRLQALETLHRPVAFASAAALSLLVAAGGPIAALVLGGQWTSAGSIIAVLAFGGILQAGGQITYWAMLASGNAKVLLLTGILPRVLFMICVFPLAHFGVLAVAMCVTAQQLLLLSIGVAWALPKTGIPLSRATRAAVGPILPFLAFSIAVLVLKTLHAHSVVILPVSPDLLGSLAWSCLVCGLLAVSKPTRAAFFAPAQTLIHTLRTHRHPTQSPTPNS